MESKEFLEKWIVETLSKPHKILSDLPICPFAKNAYLENKVKIIEVTDYVTEITDQLTVWDDSYEVLVFVCPDNVIANDFVENVGLLNEKFMPTNLVLLEDHIDLEEKIDELVFNNGKYNIVLVQRLDKLNQAAEKLHKTAYYKNWPKDYYEQVVSWRNNE
jgi:hypothetical protein